MGRKFVTATVMLSLLLFVAACTKSDDSTRRQLPLATPTAKPRDAAQRSRPTQGRQLPFATPTAKPRDGAQQSRPTPVPFRPTTAEKDGLRVSVQSMQFVVDQSRSQRPEQRFEAEMTVENRSGEERTITQIYLIHRSGMVYKSSRILWDGERNLADALKDLKPGQKGTVNAEFASARLPADTSTLQLVVQYGVFTDKFIEFPVPLLYGVGQGEDERRFLDAYIKAGGRSAMGEAASTPYWLRAGNASTRHFPYQLRAPADPSDLLVQEFSGGSTWSRAVILFDKQGSAKQAYVLGEPLLAEYERISRDAQRTLGAPKGEMVSVSGSDGRSPGEGMYAPFETGVVWWHAGDAGVMTGDVFEKWQELGFGSGALGFPTSGPNQTHQSGSRNSTSVGTVTVFQSGAIYEVNAERVVALHGPVAQTFSNLGGPESWVGFPVEDQYTNVLGRETANFEGGYIASPDGRAWQAYEYETGKIAFVTEVDGNKEIYVMEASGADASNVTRHSAQDYAPAWSPDGSRLAFISDRSGKPEVFVMVVESQDVKVVPGTDEVRSVTWLPSGDGIAYVVPRSYLRARGQAGEVVFVSNVDGTDRVALTEHAGFAGNGVAVSPDGTLFAYIIGTIQGVDLAVTSPDSDRLEPFECYLAFGYRCDWRVIAEFNNFYRHPAWSPDGTSIAVSGVNVYDVQTGKGYWLTSGVSGAHPTWSGDSRMIAFNRVDSQGAPQEGEGIHIVYRDMSLARKISGPAGTHSEPAWYSGLGESPDGTLGRSLSSRIDSFFETSPPFPDYLLDPTSFDRAVATVWAMFTDWTSQVDLTESYKDLYYLGLHLDGLSQDAGIRAKRALNDTDSSGAEKQLERARSFRLLSQQAFSAAATVFDGQLEAGQQLAEGIKDASQASVKFGLRFVSPLGAVAADYIYMATDYGVDSTLSGTDEANRNLLIRLMVKQLTQEIPIENLGGVTLTEYAKQITSDQLRPVLEQVLQSEEALQATTQVLAELVAQGLTKVTERTAQDLLDQMLEYIVGVDVRNP